MRLGLFVSHEDGRDRAEQQTNSPDIWDDDFENGKQSMTSTEVTLQNFRANYARILRLSEQLTEIASHSKSQ